MLIPNDQPIEKQKLVADGRLKVVSVFFTIQGEAIFSGRPAVFVRLAGCNLQCPGCDTDYQSDQMWSPLEVLTNIRRETMEIGYKPLIVISGGEPFRQNIIPLVELLHKHGYEIQIETNGTLSIPHFPYDKVTIVCSPKTGKINKSLSQHIDAFKYVLEYGQVADDGLPLTCVGHPAKPMTARPTHKRARVYVQPLDQQDVLKNEANLTACLESVYAHGYTLCLQTHKIIGVE